MRRRHCALLVSCVALVVLGASVHAASPTLTPRDVITQASARITTLTEGAEDKATLHAEVRTIVSEIVDFRAFCARTLAGHWGALTEPQQLRFEAAFQSLVLSVYTKRFQPKKSFSVTFRGSTEPLDEAQVMVRTTLHGPKVGVDLDYRMHAIKADQRLSWRVIDLVIDDVSMVRTWRRSFITVLERDGFQALIAKIEKRASRR